MYQNFDNMETEENYEGWLTRDIYGDLDFSIEKPERSERFFGLWVNKGKHYTLPYGLFPNIKWDSEPMKAKIIIKTNS